MSSPRAARSEVMQWNEVCRVEPRAPLLQPEWRDAARRQGCRFSPYPRSPEVNRNLNGLSALMGGACARSGIPFRPVVYEPNATGPFSSPSPSSSSYSFTLQTAEKSRVITGPRGSYLMFRYLCLRPDPKSFFGFFTRHMVRNYCFISLVNTIFSSFIFGFMLLPNPQFKSYSGFLKTWQW